MVHLYPNHYIIDDETSSVGNILRAQQIGKYYKDIRDQKGLEFSSATGRRKDWASKCQLFMQEMYRILNLPPTFQYAIHFISRIYF